MNGGASAEEQSSVGQSARLRTNSHPKFAMNLNDYANLPINPNDFALGYGPIDDLHADFYNELAAFETLADEAWLPQLEKLRAHLETHFTSENEMMKQFGPQAFSCHLTEHENVLKVVDEVLRRVRLGELTIGQNLVRELPVWFSHHVTTMDNVLAHTLKSETPAEEACSTGSCHP